MIGLILIIILSFGISYLLYMKCNNRIIPYIVVMPISLTILIAVDTYLAGYLDPFAILAIPFYGFFSLIATFMAHQIFKATKSMGSE